MAVSYDDALTTLKIRKPYKPEGAVKIPVIVVAAVAVIAAITTVVSDI